MLFKPKNVDMTQGPIGQRLISYTIPILLGELFQQFYTMVDSAIVGNYVGRSALAAVGASESIVRVLVGFFNGMAVGFTVVIARYYGAKDNERLNHAVNSVLQLAFMLGAVMTGAGLLLLRPILRLMNTPEETFLPAVTYLTIYFSGILGFVLYNTVAGILRAIGDVRTPLRCLLISSALNIGLDLLLVLRFNMEVAGVAVATISSQWIATLLGLRILTHRSYGLKVDPLRHHLSADSALLFLRMGVPTGFQKTITSVSNVLVLSHIVFFGEACLAGWVVYNKLDHILGVFAQSIGSALSTFVSQNLGARQFKRLERGIRGTLAVGTMMFIAISAVLVFFRSAFVRLFGSDSETIYYAEQFVLVITFFKLTQLFMNIYAGALRGTGRMLLVTVIMLGGIVGFRQLYLAAIIHIVNTPWSVGLSYPAGWSFAGLTLFLVYVFKVRREWRSEAQNS